MERMQAALDHKQLRDPERSASELHDIASRYLPVRFVCRPSS